MRYSVGVFILLPLVCVAAAAQTPAATSVATIPAYQLNVRKMHATIKVDGKLDEEVWREIEPITRFIQTTPDEGQPVSQRTEAYIFYDENNIYLTSSSGTIPNASITAWRPTTRRPGPIPPTS